MKTVCGTPGYCAPEILRGCAYGPEVDMWSLGVITYILLCGFEPFYDERGDQYMFKRILNCHYRFVSPWWDDVSLNAKDLVRKLIVLDPKKRLTTFQALQHPWVTGKAANFVHMDTAQKKLQEFNARRKLKAAVKAVVASTRLGSASSHSNNYLQDTYQSNITPIAQEEEEIIEEVIAVTLPQHEIEIKDQEESQTEPEAVAEAQAEAKAEAQAETKAEAQAEAMAEDQAEAMAEDQAEAKAEVQAEAMAEAQAEAKAEAQAEAMAEDQAEAMAEDQAEAMAEALPEEGGILGVGEQEGEGLQQS
ncbi:calcium/calmodulin-dependent protein kinase type IV isoform X2 [Notamacropus eugenii]